MPISYRLTCLLIAISLAPAAGAQPMGGGGGNMADSVVSRLVAWRARTDQPVALAALTAFDWDSFSVVRAPAGDSMANCSREGLVPCGPELHPPPGTQVQVLRFDRAGQQVYQERIMVPLGNFADPLPSAVTRARATLVTCADGGGAPLGCLQSGAQPGVSTGTQPGLRWLDGS
jgi:hypothetical protein